MSPETTAPWFGQETHIDYSRLCRAVLKTLPGVAVTAHRQHRTVRDQCDLHKGYRAAKAIKCD